MSATNILCWDPVNESIRPMTSAELDDFAVEILEYMAEYNYDTGNLIVEEPNAEGFNKLSQTQSTYFSSDCVQFSDDGLKMFFSYNAGTTKYVGFRTLSYPYTLGYEDPPLTLIELTPVVGSVDDFKFFDSGSKFYVYSNVDERLYYFTLSTPFDITTRTLQGSLLLSSLNEWSVGTEYSRAFTLSPNGTKLYLIIDFNNQFVSQYTLGTAYDITTASQPISGSLSTQQNISISFDDTGDSLITLDLDGVVSVYDCDTSYNAPYTLVESRRIDDTATGFTFDNTGTRLFMNSGGTVEVYELQGAYGFNELPPDSTIIGVFTDKYYESYDTLAGETPYELVTFTQRIEITRSEAYTRDYTTTDFEGVGSTEVIYVPYDGPTYLGPGPDTFINPNWPFYAEYFGTTQVTYVGTVPGGIFGYVGPGSPATYLREFYGPQTFYGTNPNITPYVKTFFGQYTRDYLTDFGVVASTEDFIGNFSTNYQSSYIRYYGGDFIGTIDQVNVREISIYYVSRSKYSTFPDVPSDFMNNDVTAGVLKEGRYSRQTIYEDLADLVIDNLLSDGPGTYEITQSATPPTGGTWELIHEFRDALYNDVGRLDNRNRLWKKISQTKGTYYRPLKLVTSGNEVILQEFTDGDIEQIVRIVQNRIHTTGIGSYEMTLVGQGAPATGLWQNKGAIQDYEIGTLVTSATYDGYAGTYVRDVLGTTENFGGTYSTDYVTSTPYTGSYDVNPAYIGPFGETVFTNFIRYGVSFNGYTGTAYYIGTRYYLGERTYIGTTSYLGTYTGEPVYTADYINENDQYQRDYISGSRLAASPSSELTLWRRYQ